MKNELKISQNIELNESELEKQDLSKSQLKILIIKK